MDMPQRVGNGAPQARPTQNFLQRQFRLTLSFGRLLAILFFGGGVLIWVFFFGILLGRGLNPEDKLPELANLMPSAPESTPAASVDVPPDNSTGSSSPSPADSILRPDELAYHTSLKGTSANAPSTGRTPSPSKTPSTGNTRPIPPAASSRPPAAKPSIAQTGTGKSTPAAQPVRETFDYVYQVAAFKGNEPAETLRKRLQAAGLKASVEKQATATTTWYKTLVHFRGEPDDTRLLRDKLSTMGIDRILMRSKKPVKP